jgi:hypothetical protein
MKSDLIDVAVRLHHETEKVVWVPKSHAELADGV